MYHSLALAELDEFEVPQDFETHDQVMYHLADTFNMWAEPFEGVYLCMVDTNPIGVYSTDNPEVYISATPQHIHSFFASRPDVYVISLHECKDYPSAYRLADQWTRDAHKGIDLVDGDDTN